jgi:hypothetical protein
MCSSTGTLESAIKYASYILNLPPPKVRDLIDDDPGERPPEIDSFMENKGHDTCGRRYVSHGAQRLSGTGWNHEPVARVSLSTH